MNDINRNMQRRIGAILRDSLEAIGASPSMRAMMIDEFAKRIAQSNDHTGANAFINAAERETS